MQEQIGSWKIDPQNPFLYRMTRIELVEPILRAGYLSAPNLKNIPEYELYPLGKPNMTSKRAVKVVKIPPLGTLHDYVACYFAPRSPMLYSIYKGMEDGVHCPQNQIIYWVTNFEKIKNLKWLFTDINATANYAQFYDKKEQLAGNVNFDLMREIYWNDTTEDRTRKEHRAAEFLIHNQIPISSIIGIAVMNNNALTHVKEIVDKFQLNLHLLIKPQWYY